MVPQSPDNAKARGTLHTLKATPPLCPGRPARRRPRRRWPCCSARHEHHAIGQQGGRGIRCGAEPGPRRRSRTRWLGSNSEAESRGRPKLLRRPPAAPCHRAGAWPCRKARPQSLASRWRSRTRRWGRIARRSHLRQLLVAARHQHLAIGQQRRRVLGAAHGHAPGGGPGAAAGVVQLGRGSGSRRCRRCRPSPAPCHWAAAWPCDGPGPASCSRWWSMSRCWGRTARRRPVPPLLAPPATSTLPSGSSVAVW